MEMEKPPKYLFPVGPDEGEDKTAVHDRQQVIEEEGQTHVESLHQFQILWTHASNALHRATLEIYTERANTLQTQSSGS